MRIYIVYLIMNIKINIGMAGKEHKLFIEFLKSKNLSLTKQRMKILNAFLRIEGHVCAEELYDIIKKDNPEIGLATVFRCLKLLSQADIAQEIDFGDKIIRYEHKYGHQHHDHLICEECGDCIEVVDLRIERIQEELCKKENFLPQDHRLEIFGLCQKCKDKARGDN